MYFTWPQVLLAVAMVGLSLLAFWKRYELARWALRMEGKGDQDPAERARLGWVGIPVSVVVAVLVLTIPPNGG